MNNWVKNLNLRLSVWHSLSLGFLIVSMNFVLACQSSGSSSSNTLQNTVVQVHAASDDRLLGSFDVELADDASERSMGLMYRQELAADAGMLFIFNSPTTTSFWMRNTSLPLDIIFIGEDYRILTIGTGVPFSDTPVSASAPFFYVLEINQGRAAQLGINVGDRVEFSLL